VKVLKTASAMEAFVDDSKKQGRRVSFVPTMGALHEGHLSLFRAARREGDLVVVSLFVNPTQFQFNDSKDFEKYPRPLEDDLEKCRREKVDAVFTPDVGEIYPKGFRDNLRAGPLALKFEGA
jgi:pantoate--beta-alanine ligase